MVGHKINKNSSSNTFKSVFKFFLEYLGGMTTLPLVFISGLTQDITKGIIPAWIIFYPGVAYAALSVYENCAAGTLDSTKDWILLYWAISCAISVFKISKAGVYKSYYDFGHGGGKDPSNYSDWGCS